MNRVNVFVVSTLVLIIVFLAGCALLTDNSAQQAESQDQQQELDDVDQRIRQVEEKLTTVEKKIDDQAPSQPDDGQIEPVVVVEKQQSAADSSAGAGTSGAQGTESSQIAAAPSVEKAQEDSIEPDPRVADLLSRADKKVKSFSYTLAPPPDQLARDKWMVRGPRIRVTLFEDNYVEPDTYFDNIFLDTEKKTAVGACLDQRTTRCAKKGQEFELDFDAIMQKTPYQWLKEISGNPRIVSTELLYDRKMDVVQYTKSGQPVMQWIDQFSGLPVRVQISDDKNSRVEFRYMSINSVTEEEVTKPE